MAGAIILMIAYGYPVQEGDDPYVDLADKALDEIAQATTPGAFLVDSLPILQYVPAWFPGAHFKTLAAQWREHVIQMVDVPLDIVKRQLREGTAIPSFTSRLLEEDGLTPEKEHSIKWTAAAIYGGGADTVG